MDGEIEKQKNLLIESIINRDMNYKNRRSQASYANLVNTGGADRAEPSPLGISSQPRNHWLYHDLGYNSQSNIRIRDNLDRTRPKTQQTR